MRTRRLLIITYFLVNNFQIFAQQNLNVGYEAQKQDQMCWAACIKMITNAHNLALTQCDILSSSLISESLINTSISCDCSELCPSPTTTPTCNKSMVFPDPLKRIFNRNNFNASVSYAPNSVFGFGQPDRRLDWTGIKGQINNRKPFILLVDGSHVIVGKAYIESTLNSIVTNDPYNCNNRIIEYFYYDKLPCVYDILPTNSLISSVKETTTADICEGGIRKKLSPAEFKALAETNEYDSIAIYNKSPKRQLINCSKKCKDKFVVTNFEWERTTKLWRPTYISLQKDGCVIYIIRSGVRIALSNSGVNAPDADTTISFKKIILSPYPYEVYVFEYDDRVLLTPANGDFFNLNSSKFYTPQEIGKEYLDALIRDYSNLKIDYLNPIPVFPLKPSDLSLVKQKSNILKPNVDKFNLDKSRIQISKFNVLKQ